MATRTVRLDDEAEQALKQILRTTDESVSWALKQGLIVLSRELAEPAGRSPFEIYAELDLGPGGYASAPSMETRRGVREALLRKARR